MLKSQFILPHAGRRYFMQNMLRFFAFSAVLFCLCFLGLLISRMIYQGAGAFYNYKITLPITFDLSKTDINDPHNPSMEDLRTASYNKLWQDALLSLLPNLKTREEKKAILRFVTPEASFLLRDMMVEHSQYQGQTQNIAFDVSSKIDMYIKHHRDDLKEYNFDTLLIGNFQHPYFSVKKKRAVFSTTYPIAKLAPNAVCGKPKEDKAYRCDLNRNSESIFLSVGKVYAKVKFILIEDKKQTLFVELMTPFSGELVREIKGWSVTVNDIPEARRKISDIEILTAERFLSDGVIKSSFPNIPFFVNGDSRNPEQAGLGGAFIGSLMTLAVCLLAALPVGVCAAVYLEEFASKNRMTEFFEVNINNLASVPSIIYGLLGLSLLLNIFGLPRSAPLVGGIVLGIMSLPVMIIATRAALRTVPQSTRDAALALGATEVQTFFHHTLPAAIPGIMTGSVLSLSRAIGETAPLLLIGMVAFVSDIPQNITDTATVLPVQIFLWTENPEAGYTERTAAAVLVLLFLMICMNGCAIYFRNKFERKY